MTCIILIFIFEIIISQLFSHDFKLSILSNHIEYPKELVPIIYYIYYVFLQF